MFNRKIVVSLMLIALVSALVGGATFAAFTDTASNSNNTFTTGTLDIAVNDETAFTGTIGNLVPGDTGSQTFTLANSGTLALDYTVAVSLTSGANTLVQGDATKDLEFVIEKSTDEGTTWAAVANGAQSSLSSGASEQYRVTYTLPAAADNAYQGKSSAFQITFDATNQ